MRYHIITLGCQMNKSDSERVQTVVEGLGFRWTDDEDQADLLGILACSVRQKAIDKVYSKIYAWNKAKDKRNLLTFVSGCILPADKVKFLKLFDLVFTMDELPDVPDMIRHYGVATPFSLLWTGSEQVIDAPAPRSDHSNGFPSLLELLQKKDTNPGEMNVQSESITPSARTVMDGFWHIQPHYTSLFEAFVPIQNGCDKFCTFCAVPYTRGREVSRPSSEILLEIQSLINRDYKSITLLGQNVNSYGLDKSGKEISFPALLEEIGKMGKHSGKEFWVYFTSPHPRDMTREVIDVISKYRCLARQIHLPLQSGDNNVLVRMNRKHTVEKYRDIVQYIRKTLPEATLFTDIIVGFTGESDLQFENTRNALKEFEYNMAYIAIYSPRPGAVSARWQDDIPHAVKKERLHTLTADLEITSRKYTREMVGNTYPVLITGLDRKKKYLVGYTEGRINVRIPLGNYQPVGRFVNVKIQAATDFSVEGAMVTEGKKQNLHEKENRI